MSFGLIQFTLPFSGGHSSFKLRMHVKYDENCEKCSSY